MKEELDARYDEHMKVVASEASQRAGFALEALKSPAAAAAVAPKVISSAILTANLARSLIVPANVHELVNGVPRAMGRPPGLIAATASFHGFERSSDDGAKPYTFEGGWHSSVTTIPLDKTSSLLLIAGASDRGGTQLHVVMCTGAFDISGQNFGSVSCSNVYGIPGISDAVVSYTNQMANKAIPLSSIQDKVGVALHNLALHEDAKRKQLAGHYQHNPTLVAVPPIFGVAMATPQERQSYESSRSLPAEIAAQKQAWAEQDAEQERRAAVRAGGMAHTPAVTQFESATSPAPQ